ncbi:MAG TPA: RelA/SpoT domain-containing protein, partial [Ktedonobacteraceae bacterium]|nr:RelA/SpoT domain-containing protein [Ktedonobacteraceae bacterium]
VKQARDFYTDKRKSRGLKHTKVNEKDYISNPKPDGYRSMHLIYKYKSDKKSTYDGLLVELQIRSKIQHAWATAVETVDLFTKQAIKSNEGNPEWVEFFRLVSSAFAFMEGEAPVPGTPTNPEELKREIKKLVGSLRVFQKMERWMNAMQAIEPKIKELHFFLLVLDVTTTEKEKLEIRGYPKDAERMATDHYLEAEKMQGRDPNKDVVLVAADSVDELKKAYPNYFIDTSLFLNYLRQYLKG